ncbi:TetR/AcrR family transcriptional regulator [Anoxybacillus ayderensis]|uniref:TetR/AcrR family transcriptional regulator n=1 Tax=Anoxybacillus ayderensis TaxID=265546 RepID=UPI002E1D8CAD|nr:TetR/AcrR family transcriptional regulator [Anoxybacillus ayderensis]
MKREKQKKQTRILLQQTALRLFQKQGYEQTTVLQITNEAGVAKGTFFNYFRTKEEVLQSVFSTHVERICKRMQESEERMWHKQIEQLFYELTTMHEKLGKEVTKSMVHIYAGKQQETLPFTPFIHMLTNIFEEGKQCGDIRTKRSSETLSLIALQLYFGALKLWMFSHLTEPLSTFTIDTITMFIDYMKKEGD